MAHASQERYSALVDAKLRATLVTRDNTIFNNRYEGSPKAGKVKIPVRDTEVAVKAYDKANGVDADAGTTTYLDLDIDNDEAVNEIIDGFDAASVPDDITAERLDSAGYVPFDTGILKNSVNQASKFDEGLLVYNTPYARRQFYLHPEGECLHGENGLRGSYWGQRALADYGEAIAYIATQAVTTFWGGMGHL